MSSHYIYLHAQRALRVRRAKIERAIWVAAMRRASNGEGFRFGYSLSLRVSYLGTELWSLRTCARQAQHPRGKGRVTQQRVQEEHGERGLWFG
jgi:hypothetical protein